MENLQDGYLLRNGIKIPCIGFGTWKSPDDVVCESVKVAIEAGYRHIDGAAAYANEAGVGKGIRESGIPREELFITSKLPNADHGYGPAKESFERTLNQMGLEYLDLYLIHWPVVIEHKDDFEQDILDTWRAFEELYEAGKIKAIGVSNFMIEHLEILKNHAKIMPMVNQVQLHPQHPQEEMVTYCKKNGIVPEAWSPLIQGQAFKRELLKEMAQKYDRTVAQICLRWISRKGLFLFQKHPA